MRNISRTLVLLAVGVIVAIGIACSESSVIGEDFIDSGNFEVTAIDTISLKISTIQFDSIVTSNTGRLLIGSHEMEVGKITSESFFNLTYESSLLIDENYQFDSLVLTLPLDGYVNRVPDEGMHYTIQVHQLSNDLEYRSTGSLYNISEIDGAEDDLRFLGDDTFYVEPNRSTTISITIDEILGQDLYEKLIAGHEIFTRTDEFQQYLNGFKLSIAEDPSGFIGFATDSIKMTMMMSDKSQSPPEVVEYDFVISGSPHYSKIQTEDSIDALAEIEDIYDESLSDVTDDIAYIQAGSGYAIKIDLSNVRNLLLDDHDFIMAGAELKLSWLQTEDNEIPEILIGTYINGDFVDVAGENYSLTLQHDEDYNRDNFYTMDISPLINVLLEPLTDYDYYLLIQTPEFNSTTTSIMLGDQTYDSELIIYTISNNE
ncbi:DUF4270 family protein [Ekhidna sp. MALMAid0563]|uniref:DUF4270 family protein n=1 Tax=Ekhidna sp. MALMAid0563 TaxID=3143937 RepID=UPI0032DEEDC4